MGIDQSGNVACDLKRTLVSSSASEVLGGSHSYPTETSLKGVFLSYFRESFASEFEKAFDQSSNNISPGARIHFLINEDFEGMDLTKFHNSMKQIATLKNSSDTVLEHLENVGNSSISAVQGIKMPLRPFQKETLKWVVDRENMPKGARSLFWVDINTSGSSLYFSPVLGSFCRDEPLSFWGGVINEDEDLGSKQVALALTMQNPAPLRPSSGSTLKSRRAATKVKKSSKWEVVGDKCDPLSETGKIISRGTLIVVSSKLVCTRSRHSWQYLLAFFLTFSFVVHTTCQITTVPIFFFGRKLDQDCKRTVALFHQDSSYR